jgi:uncharacterized delta-60 repeat protein
LAANPGDLDPSFGNGGVVTTTIGSHTYGRAMALQSDGKIIMAGHTENSGITLARYNFTGSLDSTFGNSGIVTASINSDAQDAVIQSNGKIVVVGYNVLARYNSNGSLDSDFGGSGIITNNIAGMGIALQSDHKIVVAGYNQNVIALTRYHSNGSLDSDFGHSGVVTTSIGNGALSRAVVIQPDGKIVAAGSSSGPGAFALARYTITGTLDSTFGNGGVVTTPFSGTVYGEDVVIQSDGKIIIIGYSPNSNNLLHFTLARYNITGIPDGAFGNSGVVTTPIGISSYGEAVVLRSDGKIIIGGASYNGIQNTFALARYHPNGSLDSSFGSSGVVTTPIGATGESLDMVIQPDRQIVVAGQSRHNGQTGFALARYYDEGPAPLLIPASGGTITPTLGVTLSANSGVFSETVLLTYTPRPITSTDSLSHVGLFYELQAIYLSSGLPAQPQPGQSYTITVTYYQVDVPTGVDEADLALYYWDGVAWLKEPTSVVDILANTITATPHHFSLWATLAPSSGSAQPTTFLPTILK